MTNNQSNELKTILAPLDSNPAIKKITEERINEHALKVALELIGKNEPELPGLTEEIHRLNYDIRRRNGLREELRVKFTNHYKESTK